MIAKSTRRDLLRRAPLALAAAPLILAAGPAAAAGGFRIPVTYELFGQDAQYASSLHGWPGTDFNWSADALTGSTHNFRFDLGLGTIFQAKWRLVFNSLGRTACVTRLVHLDPGPFNITEIGRLDNGNSPSPTHKWLDITAAMQALVAGGKEKYLGHQCKGDGGTGPIVFSSRIEIIWEIPASEPAPSPTPTPTATPAACPTP
jgi:hypothetical protein